LADPRLLKSMPGWQPDPDSVYGALDGHMLNRDPPDPERLRRLANKAITAGPRDDMPTQREVNLLASLAFPLPITVICELLGIPVADRDEFRKWSASIISDAVSPEAFQADATAMVSYFRTLLAAKRQRPADD